MDENNWCEQHISLAADWAQYDWAPSCKHTSLPGYKSVRADEKSSLWETLMLQYL